MKYTTKDSGKRSEFESGMRRDTQEGKPRYDLIWTPILKRFAELLARGAKKYTENNWMMANSPEELKRFKASAFRHFMDWKDGTNDEEDHGAAVMFNIMAAEYVKEKLGTDINGDIWVQPPSLNNYEVNQFGSIRRVKDKKIMSQWVNKWGYQLVSLSGESRRHYQVHRLVLEAFVGESDLQVNHIDGVKNNNMLSNLEYVTASDNIKHGWETGLYTKLVTSGKINYDIAQEIRLRVDSGEKQRDLAKEFGISPQSVNSIVKFRCWKERLKDVR